MENSEFTNLLLKKLYKSDLEVEIKLDIDDSCKYGVQIQINVKPKYFNKFTIVYGNKDEAINYYSIFENPNIDYIKVKEIFDKNDHIFSDLIYGRENNIVYLFRNIPINELREEHIEQIVTFLMSKHKLIESLNNL